MRKRITATVFVIIMLSVLIGSGYLYLQRTEEIGAQAVESYTANQEIREEEKAKEYSAWLQSIETPDLNKYESFNLEHGVFEKAVEGTRTAKIVFLGDSTTEQNEYTNGNPGHVKLIEQELTEGFGPNVNVYNAGVSGNDLTDMDERLKGSVIKFNPDLVFINSSLNDVSNEVSVKEFKENYQTIIDRIKEETDAKIILRTSNFTMSPEINVQLEESYNDAIKEVAMENELGFIDLYSYYKDNAESHSGGINHFNFNHFHPNENGQKLIRDSVMFVLNEGNTYKAK